MNTIECPSCSKTFNIDPDTNVIFSGDWFRCPHCKVLHIVRFYSASDDTPVEAESEIAIHEPDSRWERMADIDA